MRGAWIVAIGIVGFAVAAAMPKPAESCTVGPGGGTRIDVRAPTAEQVPPDGGLVFPVVAKGADAGAFRRAVSVDVVGAPGDRPPGETLVVDLWHAFTNAYDNHRHQPYQRWLLVWRPDIRMLENETYEATVEIDRSKLEHEHAVHDDSQTFEIQVGDRDVAEVPSPSSVPVELATDVVSESGGTHCEDGQGGECPHCEFTDFVETLELAADLESADDLRRWDVVYELRPVDAEPVVDRRSTDWGGRLEGRDRHVRSSGPQLHYRRREGEHCVRPVVRSLVGSKRVGDERCFVFEEAPPADDAGHPPIHDAGHPPEYDARPDGSIDPPPPDTTPAPEPPTPEDDSNENLPWGSTGGNDGCSCSTGTPRPSPSGLIWGLVVVGAASWRRWGRAGL